MSVNGLGCSARIKADFEGTNLFSFSGDLDDGEESGEDVVEVD